MSARIVVTGTDTGIGKTVFAAALAGALDATYWKPVQSGLEDETDSGAVQRLSGLAADRILPERYRLQTPASPHLAAEIDGVDIDVAALELPSVSRPLVVEGAGGLMVPLTRETTYIDVRRAASGDAPRIRCAKRPKRLNSRGSAPARIAVASPFGSETTNPPSTERP